jgi:hypothetical protein
MLADDLLVAPVDPFKGLTPLGPNGSYTQPFNRETELWVPPGEWEHTQTGESIKGPTTINVSSEIGSMPLYHRRGGMLVLAPLPHQATAASGTDVADWSRLSLEIFPVFGDYSGEGDDAVSRASEGPVTTRSFVDTKEQQRITRNSSTAASGESSGGTFADLDVECSSQFRMAESFSPFSTSLPPLHVVTITVDAPADGRCNSHQDREWTIRFHLKRELQLISLKVAGATIGDQTTGLPIDATKASDVTAVATVYQHATADGDPHRANPVLSSCGAGQQPNGKAGDIVELRVRQGAPSRAHIELRAR